MKKIILSALLVTAFFAGVYAQQDPNYSMYMFNGLFINPAYAGSQEVVSLMAIYRDQWVGVSGAPQTANLSVHTPLKQDQYALGLVVSNDRIGLANTFNFTPSFAYRLKIKKSRLCFGVQASFAYYYENNTAAALASQTTGGPSDIAFAGTTRLFVPNFGFGIYAYGKRYFAGISVPHLLPTNLAGQLGIATSNALVSRMYNAYIATGGYVFGNDVSIVKFRPTVLIMYQQGLYKNIPMIDISPALLFIDRIWFGVTYRTGGNFTYGGQAIAPFLQVKITPQLQAGYSYDAELSALNHFTSGTHEIMLGYDFSYNKKRFVTPRYIKYF
jgi:type IX secretion system PorP/SprF family membrane protein